VRVQVPAPGQQLQAAVYCRLSVAEKVEREFDSLDAQLESCQAFVASQRGAGWTLIPEAYVDNGHTGANTKRPALERLLADIVSGKVSIVVVTKIDRLSRSLLDFVRLMELFETHQITFVSASQHIVTSTPAGRLMLNILMSFAEFERETIASRTSEFMCAARRKGKWLGGPPVLGYDIDRQEHRLVVNREEAEQVRAVFDLYLERRSMLEVAKEVNRRGWTTKSRVRKDGTRREGGQFDKAKLQRIFTNPTYTGWTQHKGKLYPGEHKAIINKTTFKQVQEIIKANGNGSGKTARNKHGALLKGLLYCASCGAAMAHTYSKKGNRLYRYYVCTTAQKQGRDACQTRSLPAQEIENFVVEQIRRLASDPDLAEQVFAEAAKQQRVRKRRLKAEQKRLQRERQHKGERIKELVAVIGASPEPLASLTDSLRELESTIVRMDQRLTEISEELTTIDREKIDKDNVTAALSLFDPIWDELYPAEKARIVNLVIERAEYDASVERVRIIFRPSEIKQLVQGRPVDGDGAGA